MADRGWAGAVGGSPARRRRAPRRPGGVRGAGGARRRPAGLPAPDGSPGAPWFPARGGRCCARRSGTGCRPWRSASARSCSPPRTPAWSSAARPGRRSGPGVVGRRDAAENDPLFRYVPLIPDVLQWHADEITELPRGATLLAASTRYPHQAFRLGDRAWGLQFHIECDAAMIADWATDSAQARRAGLRPGAGGRGLRRRCWPTSRRSGSRSPPGSPRWPSASWTTHDAARPAAARALMSRPTRATAGSPGTASAPPTATAAPAPPTCSARTGCGCGGREQEPADEAAAELLAALSRAADPDLALRQLHRIVEAERRATRDRRRSGPPLARGSRATPTTRAAAAADRGARRLVGARRPPGGQPRPAGRRCATAPDGLAPTAEGRLEPPTAATPVAALRTRVPAGAAADRGGRPDRRARPGADDGRALRAGRRDAGRGVRDRRRRAAGGHRAAPARRRGDGQVRRRRAELRLRRGRHLRAPPRTPTWPPRTRWPPG